MVSIILSLERSKKIKICVLEKMIKIFVHSGHQQTVELLIKNGADVNAKIKDNNNTALHGATYFGSFCNTKYIEIIITNIYLFRSPRNSGIFNQK